MHEEGRLTRCVARDAVLRRHSRLVRREPQTGRRAHRHARRTPGLAARLHSLFATSVTSASCPCGEQEGGWISQLTLRH